MGFLSESFLGSGFDVSITPHKPPPWGHHSKFDVAFSTIYEHPDMPPVGKIFLSGTMEHLELLAIFTYMCIGQSEVYNHSTEGVELPHPASLDPKIKDYGLAKEFNRIIDMDRKAHALRDAEYQKRQASRKDKPQ